MYHKNKQIIVFTCSNKRRCTRRHTHHACHSNRYALPEKKHRETNHCGTITDYQNASILREILETEQLLCEIQKILLSLQSRYGPIG